MEGSRARFFKEKLVERDVLRELGVIVMEGRPIVVSFKHVIGDLKES